MERQLYYAQKKYRALWLIITSIIGLYSGYWTIRWLLEAIKNFAFASETGLGQLPFLSPALGVLFAGIFTICCILTSYVLIASWNKEWKRDQDE